MVHKLSEKVYDHLCRQLLSGGLRAGDRVSELAVAKATGVSRSPVREALVRMRAEGLLEHVAKLGASVRVPSAADLEDLGRARRWLECGAVGTLAERRESAALAEVERVQQEVLGLAMKFYRGQKAELGEAEARTLEGLDTEFHLGLMRASGSRFGLESLVRVMIVIRVGTGGERGRSREDVTRLYSGHDLILRAIRRGDGAEASRLMGEHLAAEVAARAGAGTDGAGGGSAKAGSERAADWPEAMRALLEELGTGRSGPRGR